MIKIGKQCAFFSSCILRYDCCGTPDTLVQKQRWELKLIEPCAVLAPCSFVSLSEAVGKSNVLHVGEAFWATTSVYIVLVSTMDGSFLFSFNVFLCRIHERVEKQNHEAKPGWQKFLVHTCRCSLQLEKVMISIRHTFPHGT